LFSHVNIEDVNNANGNYKTSINEQDSDNRRNIDLPISCGKHL